MQRTDLLFLSLITALAAVATVPPPPPVVSWAVADAAMADRPDPAKGLALQIDLDPIP